MEWALKKDRLNYYDAFIDTGINREDTAEMIVPDLYPDILRIVDTNGIVCMKSKDIRDGYLEIEGIVRAVVLYVPENGRGIRKLDVYIPFRQTVENPSLEENSKACVRISLQSLETRVINPRKVLVRSQVIIHVKAYNGMEMEICSDIENDEHNSIQMLKKKENLYIPLSVKDKSFTVMDEIEIPNTKPAAAEILKADIRLTSKDNKTIGNKVVLKGAALIKTMYRENGYEDSLSGIHTIENELPFSQIIEIEGADEQADNEVELTLSGVDMDIRSEGGEGSRVIYVNLNVNAQIISSMEKEIETVADMYSTTYDIALDSNTQNFTKLIDKGTKHMALREILETGTQAESVMDVTVNMGPVTQESSDGMMNLTSHAMVSVLFKADDGELYSVNRNIPVTCPIEMNAGANCNADAVFSGEAFGAGLTNGIEVRFAVDFNYSVTRKENMSMVTGMRADTENVKDNSGRPSLVLKHMRGDESIWSLAKHYNTTIEDIITANNINEKDESLAGKLLLIPRKR